MAFSPVPLLLRRSSAASSPSNPLPFILFSILKSTPFSISPRFFSAGPLALPSNPPDSPKTSLSARLSFVLDQIDSIDRDRTDRDAALQRIRAWHQNKPPPSPPPPPAAADGRFLFPAPQQASHDEARGVPYDWTTNESMKDVLRKEVELVHPWPEWIELMERLAQQNYFDFRRTDEERIAENLSIDLSEIKEEIGFDFSRDWTTVRNACMNLGRDRFDILRSLSRKDVQILVGYGCPSMDPKVVFSAKLLRKLVHLDEGEVCSSCKLRHSCSRGYILTRKEDEARTLDVMRILLTFAFDHVKESVENKDLMKMKSVKTVARKLLHEIVKLSAVPIDPNLPPPVTKKPPPKVKQTPPPPKKRVGRDDVEMKKGDWLCTKCDFMNFAKNIVCLQCDAKRPKRQLLPGEWECPQCNFLNYRRNIVCFHCDHKRPPDEYTENQMHTNQSSPRTRLERTDRRRDVPSAWNFDFDDNESDGADVAAFEFADSLKGSEGYSGSGSHRGTGVLYEDDALDSGRSPRTPKRSQYFNNENERKSNIHSRKAGFDDFDDEEDDDVDCYELDNTEANKVSRMNYSALDKTSESEGPEEFDNYVKSNQAFKDYISDSEDEGCAHHPYRRTNYVVESRHKTGGRDHPHSLRKMSFGSDDDYEPHSNSNERDEFMSKQGNGHARRGRIPDFDDDDYLRMESDNDGLQSTRNKRWNFTTRASQREGRAIDRMSDRKNSFPKGRDRRLPSRELHMRGNRTEAGHRNFRRKDEFQQFDRRGDLNEFGAGQQGRRNQLPGRTRGSQRNESDAGHRNFRQKDEFQQFDRRGDLNEFGAGQRGRRNQLPGRTRGSQRNERDAEWE